jgi:hypothetical protein
LDILRKKLSKTKKNSKTDDEKKKVTIIEKELFI